MIASPNTEPLFRAVGLVAVSCALLESRITDLCVGLDGTPDALARYAGQEVKANIAKARELLQPRTGRYIDVGLVDEVTLSLDRAGNLTEQRNAVIHATWSLPDFSFESYIGNRPRRRQTEPDRNPWTVTKLVALSDKLWDECATVGRWASHFAPIHTPRANQPGQRHP